MLQTRTGFYFPPENFFFLCVCERLQSCAQVADGGVFLCRAGDHGYVEDLCVPRRLRPGHLPDVLLTSRPCQVRDAQIQHFTVQTTSAHMMMHFLAF